jgi:hypothetical protein
MGFFPAARRILIASRIAKQLCLSASGSMSFRQLLRDPEHPFEFMQILPFGEEADASNSPGQR